MTERAPRGYLAVDIGGTKLAAGIVSAQGEILVRDETPTVGDDAEELFGALTGVVDEVRTRASIDLLACGVACGGPMTSEGVLVSPLNIPQWRDFPLRARIAAHVGTEAFLDNDAKALALGEGWQGAARGVENYLAMVVSTGVGGGIVLDGRLLDGDTGNAGHIGHVIVEPDGRRCGCGAYGCLEAEASGLALSSILGDHPATAPPELKARSGRLVGRAVASVANLLDLQLAVVAGSVALGFGDDFFAAAQAELDERCRISFSRGTRIVPAGLGGDAPLVGAAAVARRALGETSA